jgi:hypothetical protein
MQSHGFVIGAGTGSKHFLARFSIVVHAQIDDADIQSDNMLFVMWLQNFRIPAR